MGRLPELGLYTVAVTPDSHGLYEDDCASEYVSDFPCILEIWKKDGVLHRTGGPAITRYDETSGEVIIKEWYENGKRHRESAPAFIYKHCGFNVEIWYKEGEEHRENAPALIDKSIESGLVINEQWYVNGLLHRNNGAAIVRRDPDSGIAVSEQWYINGKLHRDGGAPAVIVRDENNGLVLTQLRYQHGNEVTATSIANNLDFPK